MWILLAFTWTKRGLTSTVKATRETTKIPHLNMKNDARSVKKTDSSVESFATMGDARNERNAKGATNLILKISSECFVENKGLAKIFTGERKSALTEAQGTCDIPRTLRGPRSDSLAWSARYRPLEQMIIKLCNPFLFVSDIFFQRLWFAVKVFYNFVRVDTISDVS